jgi:hypothetical protein
MVGLRIGNAALIEAKSLGHYADEVTAIALGRQIQPEGPHSL